MVEDSHSKQKPSTESARGVHLPNLPRRLPIVCAFAVEATSAGRPRRNNPTTHRQNLRHFRISHSTLRHLPWFCHQAQSENERQEQHLA